MKVFRVRHFWVWLISCLGLTILSVQAQDGWRLAKDKDQIKVYTRDVPGSRSTEIKVDCLMPGTQNQLVAMLSDIANYKNVMYKTKAANLVRRVSETELVYYVVTALPWPVSDRDMSVQLTFAQDPVTKVVQVKGVGVPNMVAPRPNTVRIADWLAVWQIKQLPRQQLQVIYTCRVDPGGDIPAWLDNMAAANSAYQSFTLIRNSISLPRYQGKTYSFLTQ
ncbi:START domain-containing protein [Spirosoma aerophilum]